MLRNRFLGGVSSLVCYAPEDGAGGGGTVSGTAAATIAGGADNATRDAGGDAAPGGTVPVVDAPAIAPGQGPDGVTPTPTAADPSKTLATDPTKSTPPDPAKPGTGDPAKPAADTPKPATTPTFPEDWRAQLAGEDKAALKQLERFASPKALWDSLKQLQTKISAGELKPVKEAPGADAKPEEVAAWRKEQGLPEKPEDYVKDLKLGDGLVLPDADKPVVDNFAAIAHKANVSKDAFDQLVTGYYAMQDAEAAARREADAAFHDDSLSQLSQEWGTETKANQRAIANLLETAPGGLSKEGLGTQILLARLPNGRVLGDDPGACRYLTQLSREINPMATLAPPGTPNAGAFVKSRMSELEGLMGDPRSAYNYGPQKNALQQEYRDLVNADLKMKARA